MSVHSTPRYRIGIFRSRRPLSLFLLLALLLPPLLLPPLLPLLLRLMFAGRATTTPLAPLFPLDFCPD